MQINKDSVVLTIGEARIISKLLEMASNEFSNHGCNELDEDFFSGVSEVDEDNLLEGLKEESGDDEFEPSLEGVGDDALMRYFSEKLNI